jgi:hypothetical protein
MLAYFGMHDKVVNTDTINYIEVIDRSDVYQEPHVIIKFDGGNFLEFPPEVGLYMVFATLQEQG